MVRDHWLPLAACRDSDTNLFFPTSAEKAAPAVAICSACVVQPLCLAYAVNRPELTGVWGGTLDGQRLVMRRRSRQVS